MSIIIETKGLAFLDILRYPDMQIKYGKATFLTGKSGTGKSTLLHLINGTLSPSAGDILYNGASLARMDMLALRREIILAGQSVFLFDKSIRDNFAEFYSYRGEAAPDEGAMRRFLQICMADFGLEKDCAAMSGGERHRVFLAICLSVMPKVLLLDEPTSALDAISAREVMANLAAFCAGRGMTLLVVSHDRALTEEFADAVIEIGEIGGGE